MLLPTPLSFVKKILRILKSSFSPNQIAFSFALGLFAGLPPMGVHVILPITFALLVRCSFRMFLLSMGLFKLISLALAPGSYAIGRFLLDTNRGLDGFWRWLFHLPVIAPMGYGRYLLFGSLVLSFLLAIPVFFLVRLLVIKYRESFTAWVSSWRISRALAGRRGTGLARRFLAGGEAKYIEAKPPRGVFRLIRKEMLIGLPIVYAICYLLAAVIVPFFAGGIATSAASLVVGSDVAVEESSFSLFTGGLTLSELTVQDPKRPAENVLVIPKLTLDAGMVPLLAKKVVFNTVRIGEAALHVEREEDGTLNVDNFTSGWNAEAYLDWAIEHADRVDWLGLLRRFFEYLSEVRPFRPKEDPYASYRGGRSFPGFGPAFTIERLEVGRIAVRLRDRRPGRGPLPPLTLLEVELSNLAFPAALSGEPRSVRLHGQLGDDPEAGFTLAATFDTREGVPTQHYTMEWTKIDLAQWSAAYETTLPVSVDEGEATLSAELAVEGEAIEGTASLLLEGLHLGVTPGRTLFGLSSELTVRTLEGINRYAQRLPIVIGFPIDGSTDAPVLHWKGPLLDVAREGLLMVGRSELQNAIDRLGVEVEGLGGIENMPLDPDYQVLRDQAESTARAMITGTVERVTPDAAQAIQSLLERFLQERGSDGD